MRRAGLFVGVSCFVVVALALARPRAGTARWRETPWEEEPDAADARPRWSADGADKRDRPPPPPPPPPADASASTPAAYRALSELELATLRRLDPELFSNLPPEAGAWDPRSRNPCFRDRRDPSSGPPPLRCLPFYHVVGAWQSGTRAFNAELAAARRSVHLAPETHFWNEDKPVRAEYLPRFDAFAATLARSTRREEKEKRVSLRERVVGVGSVSLLRLRRRRRRRRPQPRGSLQHVDGVPAPPPRVQGRDGRVLGEVPRRAFRAERRREVSSVRRRRRTRRGMFPRRRSRGPRRARRGARRRVVPRASVRSKPFGDGSFCVRQYHFG